ncbi:MAG: uracil-DNA glycosylase [candidate division Zixibacteria bacterium]|nr:uracil-DNA glycosylase [candidate division Zixibacteria bacterium]MDH3936872.1 uracil-DNA glycosylase [candidate division Zixibacteria bacterium]MDH4033609.1 uracil-DNA glycosylase [candidate division Zixibacteria bacterium]
MDDRPLSLQEMLRRALASQVEMGMGEVILPPRVSSEIDSLSDMQLLNRHERTTPVTEMGTLFAREQGAGAVAPQYGSLDLHFDAVKDCQACSLGSTRTKFVYGVGNPKADLLFIGEAPGADEDRLGEPFVGRAGQLLDKIIAAIKLSRQEVYIANILKCRPPGNRDPQPAEMEQCFPILKEQVALIQPKLICALGRIAAQALLKTTTPLGKLRGRWHEYESVPMLVTYHPAALLRFASYKKDTWEDMQLLRARYDEMIG